LTMPELNGFEVFHEIKNIDIDMPIILCSGFPEQDIKQKFGEIKPSSFIQKPYHPFDLVKVLESIIKK